MINSATPESTTRSGISRTAAHLKDSLAIDIGRRLGATWVVSRKVPAHRRARSAGIAAKLVEVATGDRAANRQGRRHIDNIFALQGRIVFELTQGLNLALQGTEESRASSARRRFRWPRTKVTHAA